MNENNVNLESLVNNFTLPPSLGFGRLMAPIMFKAEFKDGRWCSGDLCTYQSISLDPAAKVLHYAQEIFEGMKAYWVDNNTPQLFRPLDNRAAHSICAHLCWAPKPT